MTPKFGVSAKAPGYVHMQQANTTLTSDQNNPS